MPPEHKNIPQAPPWPKTHDVALVEDHGDRYWVQLVSGHAAVRLSDRGCVCLLNPSQYEFVPYHGASVEHFVPKLLTRYLTTWPVIDGQRMTRQQLQFLLGAGSEVLSDSEFANVLGAAGDISEYFRSIVRVAGVLRRKDSA